TTSPTSPRITHRSRSDSVATAGAAGRPERGRDQRNRSMTDEPLHRLYHHYSELPYSQRVLYTMTLLVLGLGYLFALIYLFHTYAGRAGGNPMMLSYKDVLTAYTGSGQGSRLESALRGPMSTMLPADDAARII